MNPAPPDEPGEGPRGAGESGRARGEPRPLLMLAGVLVAGAALVLIGLRIAPLLLLLAGAVLLIPSLAALRRSALARDWPSVEGAILSSEVVSRASSRSAAYSPRVRFEYSVDGERYGGDEISPAGGGRWGSQKWARSLTDRFPPGSRAPVFFRPEDPAEAYLAPGETGGSWLQAAAGAALAAGGYAALQERLRDDPREAWQGWVAALVVAAGILHRVWPRATVRRHRMDD